MKDIFALIRERQSARTSFDPQRPVPKNDVRKILESAAWSPTAHNMQNFEVIVVDDRDILARMGAIKTSLSVDFIKENYEQLSFSEKELRKKKTGLLGLMFPPSWRDPKGLDMEKIKKESGPSFLKDTLRGGPTVMIVTYDPRKRAPASGGDVLGFISLGCVMENMWLAAQALGIGVHIMSVFSSDTVEQELKKILNMPAHLKIAFAVRLGYPASGPANYLRVRRDVEDFARYNGY
jgi:nitroreductase